MVDPLTSMRHVRDVPYLGLTYRIVLNSHDAWCWAVWKNDGQTPGDLLRMSSAMTEERAETEARLYIENRDA